MSEETQEVPPDLLGHLLFVVALIPIGFVLVMLDAMWQESAFGYIAGTPTKFDHFDMGVCALCGALALTAIISARAEVVRYRKRNAQYEESPSPSS